MKPSSLNVWFGLWCGTVLLLAKDKKLAVILVFAALFVWSLIAWITRKA